MALRPLPALRFAVLFCILSSPLVAQGTNQQTVGPSEAAEPLSGPGPTDPAELEAFVDGLMEVMLEEFNTAGAVISVVSGGQLFFAKGYGYADWEGRTPVDPATTLFRIGSVSKLFVWTSVMQMVEQGLLDLDTDVNEYLDFSIPEAFGEPVTLSDIMAHAGGFEDYVLELFGDEPEDVRPLGELLAEQIPERVRPPGDISSYSNHATGMAAYMVERAAGTEWKEYVEENIFGPLGMEYSTFRQPLPEALAPHMSKSYNYRGNRFQEEDFEYVPLAPVGAAAASATDMARFMTAHLQLGRYGDGHILSEETARLMQSDHHRMDQAVNAMAHGFMVFDANGQRIIGHGGDTRWFHTGLWLFPEHDLGVFVSFNSREGGGARGVFQSAFLDRYFPVEEALPSPPEDVEEFKDRVARLTGEFRSNRFSHSTFTKIGAVETESVHATDRGTLRALSTDWVQVAPLTFQEEYGDRSLIFREDESGAITHFFVNSTPIIAWERVPALERTGPNAVLFILAIATIVLTLLSPLVGWVVRRWYGVAAGDLVRIGRGARLALWVASLLFGVGLLLIAARVASSNIAVELPPELGIIFLLPVLAIVPTLASVLFAFRIWTKAEGRLTVRVLYTAAVLVFCLFLGQLYVWNMLGWNY
jgi:CubicO group peptidase (beta-lactamase class C family)